MEGSRINTYDNAVSVAVGPGGRIYVAGDVSGTLPGQTSGDGLFSDAYVRAYDANGKHIWTRQFGTPISDEANGVAVDASGNVYVAGWTEGTLPGHTNAPGGTDAFLRKYDANGNQIWSRQFGTTDPDAAAGVAVDTNGDVYVVGYTYGAFPGHSNAGPGYGDAFIRKYNTGGAVLWTRQFGTPYSDGLSAVTVDALGDIYIAGGQGEAFGPPGRPIAFVRKFNANGTELWMRPIGLPSAVIAYAVAVDADSSVYVAGTARSAGSDEDAFLRKYDANGSELWTRQFGGSSGDPSYPTGDYAYGVAVGTGGIYLTGVSEGTLPGQTGDGGAFLRNYEADGTERWTQQFSNPLLGGGLRVAVDAVGGIYTAGSVIRASVPVNNVDAVLTKVVVSCPSIPGDVNGDCLVDCEDLAVVRSTLGSRPGQSGFYPPADVVSDNVIDVRDLVFVSQRLTAGTKCSQ